MAQVVITITDGENEQLTVEGTTSHPDDVHSPANLIAAFLRKYWEVIMASAAQEYQHALAEAANKPVETAPKLLGADGHAISNDVAQITHSEEPLQ